jgi:hypothetical protein
MLFFGSDFGLKFSTTMGVLVTAISSFACVDIDARQFSRHDLDLSQAEEPVPDSVARCRASCQEFNDKFRAKPSAELSRRHRGEVTSPPGADGLFLPKLREHLCVVSAEARCRLVQGGPR